jgi:hypothetical protein
MSALENRLNYFIIYFKAIKREVVNWINLAQVRDQWQALVEILMNLQIP